MKRCGELGAREGGAQVKKLSDTLKETEITKAVLEYLSLRGIFAWRNNSGAARYMNNGKQRFVKFSFTGASDILGIVPTYSDAIAVTRTGRFLAIEVKTCKGKLSLDQKAFLEAVRQNGGLAIVATSLEDVRKVLE